MEDTVENLTFDTEELNGQIGIQLEFEDDDEDENVSKRPDLKVKFNSDHYLYYGPDQKHKLRVELVLNLRTHEYIVHIYNRGSTRLNTDTVKDKIAKIIVDAWDQRMLSEVDFLKKAQIKHFADLIQENEDQIKSYQNDIEKCEEANRKYQRMIDDIECGI